MAARIDDGSTIQLTRAKPDDLVSLPFGFIGDTLLWDEKYINFKITPLHIEKSASDAPKIQRDVTVVPLRFVGEATGRKVVWDDKPSHGIYHRPENRG